MGRNTRTVATHPWTWYSGINTTGRDLECGPQESESRWLSIQAGLQLPSEQKSKVSAGCSKKQSPLPRERRFLQPRYQGIDNIGPHVITERLYLIISNISFSPSSGRSAWVLFHSNLQRFVSIREYSGWRSGKLGERDTSSVLDV